jgi:hypothetical protein
MTATTVSVGGRELPLGSDPRVGRLRRTDPRTTPVADIRARLEQDGYVFLPRLLPPHAVLAAQQRMTECMAQLEGDEAFLDTDAGGRALLPGRTPTKPWQTGWLQEQPEVMAVVEGPELFGFFEQLFDEPAATFDYKWFRNVGRGGSSAFHFDGVYMCRDGQPDDRRVGALIGQRQHTVWVPWHDVPIGESGLCVVEGSHRLPGFATLREKLGGLDVNYTEVSGFSLADPLQVLAFDPAARLLTDDYEAGDVVLFGMYMLHGSSENRSERVRLSCDIRFQPRSDPVDKRHTADGQICRGIDERNRYPGPKIPLAEALVAWGCAPELITVDGMVGARL